jgi:hypothetical protein
MDPGGGCQGSLVATLLPNRLGDTANSQPTVIKSCPTKRGTTPRAGGHLPGWPHAGSKPERSQPCGHCATTPPDWLHACKAARYSRQKRVCSVVRGSAILRSGCDQGTGPPHVIRGHLPPLGAATLQRCMVITDMVADGCTAREFECVVRQVLLEETPEMALACGDRSTLAARPWPHMTITLAITTHCVNFPIA